MKRVLLLLIFVVPTTIFANESNVYDFSWLDPDKKVYVLQNRKFRKSGKLYLGTTFGRSLSGAFIDSNEANVYAGFFFHEDWGIEVSYTKASGTTNNTHDGVNEQGAVAFYRKVDTAQSAMLMWSPFYSKINTFNKIFYFDWMFGAGVASVTTLDNRLQFEDTTDETLTSESNTGMTWMSGFRFFISDSWSTRLDFRAIHVNADTYVDEDETKKRWSHFYSINLGLNFTF